MTGAPPWTPELIPDLTGRRALVTGVTSGIGEKTVLELARHGAEVILGARNRTKLEKTMSHVREALPEATLHPLVIDLSDLTSVRMAAEQAAKAAKRVAPAPLKTASAKPHTDQRLRQILLRLSIIIFCTAALSSIVFQSTTFALPKVLDERMGGIAG